MPQKAEKPIPEGMHNVTMHFWFNGNCREAIEFYRKAFNAEMMTEIVPSPDGKGVWHATLKIGDSPIFLADAGPGNWEHGPREGTTVGVFLYVEDCDAVFKQVVEAGAEVLMPMEDMFWGDRMGKVKDPFGHTWAIATHKFIMTPEDMAKMQGG